MTDKPHKKAYIAILISERHRLQDKKDYSKMWKKLFGVQQNSFLLLPGYITKERFPASFAVRYGHVTEFQPME